MKKNFTPTLLLLLSFALFQSCQKDEDMMPTPGPEPLSPEEEYFLDVALGSEFGSSSSTIKKWATNLQIFIQDSSHVELVEEFERIQEEINGLSEDIQLKRVYDQSQANFVIFFSDKDTYANYEPSASNFVDSNWGLVWIYWNGQCQITRGSMYVDVVRNNNLDCMKHLLREELTQGLGLLNDSFDYPASIFYQNWTCSPSYADVDREVLKLLFNPKIEPCMTRGEVEGVLR